MRLTHFVRDAARSGLLPTLCLFACSLVFQAGCRRAETDAGNATAAKPTTPAAAPTVTPQPAAPLHATIETDKGVIEIEFLPGDAPKTVENFRLLAGRGYYNGLMFHRIVKGFMLQTGDPQGDGRGGESAWGGRFDDEIQKGSPLYQGGLGYKRGILAMANAGPNTNGSQFFILHKDYPLAPNYTIFARVTKGIEVVDLLAETPTVRGMDGNMSKPVTPPVMKKITLRP